MTTYPFFCGKDCGGNACPLLATVEHGRITRIRHNPAAGKMIKGCQRGLTMFEQHHATDRLLTPLMRTGERGSGQFREASWDEALNWIAQKLSDVRHRYGPDAVLSMGSAGDTGALHATWASISRFLHLFGGCTELSSNYSNGAASSVLPYLLGNQWTQAGFDPATLQYAEMIVLWGANVLDTRMGAEIPERLLEAHRRGAQIVVIDPRRSATVRRAASWWLPCRPGTDAALMLAVLHVLFHENLANRAFIEAHSSGFDLLEQYVLGADGGTARSPQWAAPICGISADEITRFARAYAAAQPAMLLPGYSIQRVYAGEETFRLTVALQIATGNFGQRGGSTGAINSALPGPRVGSLPIPHIRELPAVPVLRWPDAILEGRRGGYPTNIHAAYITGANFVNQGADVRKNAAALAQLDFSVCHDLFLTPTARWCDVVLPVASAFEKEDIGTPWAGNYLLYRPQIVPPAGQSRSDYDIFCALAERLGFGEAFSEGRSAEQWIQTFMDQSDIPDQAAFRRTGIYLAPEQERVGLADFAADPRRFPLSTPSGKVEIASQRYQEESGSTLIPTWQPAPDDPRYLLRLITPKSPYRTHSQGGNLPEVQKRAAHALEMHPADAAERGINAGDTVWVFNDQGTLHIPVRLTGDLVRGVVCLPEGAWAALDEQSIDRGGAANTLTSTQGTRAGAHAVMHAVPVEVKRQEETHR